MAPPVLRVGVSSVYTGGPAGDDRPWGGRALAALYGDGFIS